MQIRFQDHDQTVMDPALKLEFPLRSRLGTRIRSSGLLCQRQHFTRQAIDLGKERLFASNTFTRSSNISAFQAGNEPRHAAAASCLRSIQTLMVANNELASGLATLATLPQERLWPRF